MSHNQYLIGPCLLECQTMCLSYQDKTIKLSVKVFELLKLFLESSENIVSREAAIESIWLGNEGVGKRGYTNAVWTLRKTFKDLGLEDENTFVTLSKVGYQLTLAVEPVNLKNHAISIEVTHSPKSTMNVTRNWLINHKMAVGFVIASVIFSMAMLVWLNVYHFNSSRSEQLSNNNIALPEFRKITNFEGIEEHPAVSNNSQYVAFQWGRENANGKIYIKDIKNSSAPLRLLTMVNDEEASPAWSYNDESLAYVRISEDGNCQVRVRNMVTNNDLLIDEGCFYSPFKRVITWSNGHDNELTYTKKTNSGVALFRYDFTTDTINQITSPSEYEFDFAPHWSNDNKSLVFIREKGAHVNEIFLQTEDNTLQTILASTVSAVDLDWDLQKNEIYTNYAEDSRFSIKRISLNNSQQSLITNHGLPSNLSFDSKTGQLFFTNHISKEYIAQISLETGKIIRKISSSSRDLYGRFVADTDDIIFLSNREDKWSVWINNKRNSINLTKDLGNATVPAVAPNGRQFVVNISSDNQNKRHLYLGSLVTGKFNKIDTHGLNSDNLSWSRDGQSIYFYGSSDTNSGIFKLNIFTNALEQISNTDEQYAVEGGDGKLYVTKMNKNGLWALDPKTKQVELITAELATYDYAAFFWQNNHIYYLNRDINEDQLKRINSTTEAEVVISYPANSIRKFFGISTATENSFLATLKITNEADINSVTTLNINQ